ncbi:Memo-like protein [Thermoplasmatales archaeon]|nr:Memo-like protein [Thermoplasmatales archaeon]
MRHPAVSGMFYPSAKPDLEAAIDKVLSAAVLPETEMKRLIGVVVPHAGYEYSGGTAAYSYNSIRKYSSSRNFVIIGPNHRGIGSSVSTGMDEWETPLGTAEVNVGTMNEIMSEVPFVENDPRSQYAEHSIEVQIPFLQRIYGKEFTFVPICMWYQEKDAAIPLGDALVKHIDEFTIIASSDLNHYQKQEITVRKDLALIDKIVELDLAGFYRTLREEDISACGYGAIATLMHVTRKMNGRIKLLHHTTSGEVTGNDEPVVGYASMVAYI